MAINQITWEETKNILNIPEEDQSYTELLIFSCSAEIESYLNRKIRERTLIEYHNGCHQRELLINEYPVLEIYTLYSSNASIFTESSLIPSDYYTCFTSEKEPKDTPQSLILADGWHFPKGKNNIKLTYRAGYPLEEIPGPIKTACIELLSWQLKRYCNNQIGVTGLVNEKHNRERPLLDNRMPSHVAELLEPYRRKTW